MKDFMGTQKLRIGNWFGIAVICISITGCTKTIPEYQEEKPKVVSSSLDGHGRPIADAIARFAVNTAPGGFGNLNLSDGRLVNVRVGQDYISAANHNCRYIWISANAVQTQKNAVCFIDDAWKTVFPW